MKSLPFDFVRCMPDVVDSWCKQCARWSNHPEQVYGPRTGIMACEGSTSESCEYINENRNVGEK